MRQRVIRSARITLYVSANVIVDKSGNYYQYNAATHSYNQVKKCDGHDGCHSRALSPHRYIRCRSDILAKADAYTGNGTDMRLTEQPGH